MNKEVAVTPADRRSADEWSEILDDWRSGGQTDIHGFCSRHGVSMRTFKWWRWALETRGPDPRRRVPCRSRDREYPCRPTRGEQVPPQTVGFVEIVRQATRSAPSERRSSGIEVVVPGTSGDRRVRVDTEFDTATFRRILSILEEV